MKLTREMIEKEPAGPRMDEWIAEDVMEWKIVGTRNGKGFAIPQSRRYRWMIPGGIVTSDIPEYSTDIAAAWEVVEKITEVNPDRIDGMPASSRFMYLFEKGNVWAMSAEEAALAFCRWALLAVLEPK